MANQAVLTNHIPHKTDVIDLFKTELKLLPINGTIDVSVLYSVVEAKFFSKFQTTIQTNHLEICERQARNELSKEGTSKEYVFKRKDRTILRCDGKQILQEVNKDRTSIRNKARQGMTKIMNLNDNKLSTGEKCESQAQYIQLKTTEKICQNKETKKLEEKIQNQQLLNDELNNIAKEALKKITKATGKMLEEHNPQNR